ncbi:MAG: hypothetical protein HRJ53_07445 [Acidobacteria bacterium Pan2503]|uniref:Uncharacterized protein n=1 Tax=Candidatus Acidiferrum panamense TaxID=2741543 RepID=A0A7V8SWM9_9BACT|nr:hypothetical protein [Candidatus Acidoferrum panamensis]
MSNLYKCNACGTIYYAAYPDGMAFFHVCTLVENPNYQPDPGKPNYDGRELVEREGHRDENLPADLQCVDGVFGRYSRDVNDPAIVNFTKAVSLCKAEGKGRTAL